MTGLDAVLLAVALAATPPPAGDGPEAGEGREPFVVVVHPSVERDAIGREELAAIFLGRVDRWEDGTRVTAVDLSTRSETRRHFSSRVLDRTVGEVIRHWSEASRRDRVPRVAASGDEAVSRVASTPGAIGYVPPETPLEGVRALAVLD